MSAHTQYYDQDAYDSGVLSSSSSSSSSFTRITATSLDGEPVSFTITKPSSSSPIVRTMDTDNLVVRRADRSALVSFFDDDLLEERGVWVRFPGIEFDLVECGDQVQVQIDVGDDTFHQTWARESAESFVEFALLAL